MKKIAIIGSGSWGVALATHLSRCGNLIKIWSFSEEEKRLINEEKRCKFLPNLTLPENIECSTDFKEVIENSEFILHVTPSKFTRETFKQYKQYVGDKPVIICSKGFEKDTLKTLDEVILDELPTAKIGVLSGPSHAEEVSIAIPTVLVIASKHDEILSLIQDTFMCTDMRIYTSKDVKGVELRRSIKKYYSILCWSSSWNRLRRQYICSTNNKGIRRINKARCGTWRTKGYFLWIKWIRRFNCYLFK